MSLKNLNKEFPELKKVALTEIEWELIEHNVDKYEDLSLIHI